MVPRLRGVVEQALVARTFRMVDDFLERLRREIGALDRGVGLVDIGLVMLAMMRRQRVGRDMRRKCVLDRKSVVSGKSVSVRVALGGRRIIKKQNQSKHSRTTTQK